MPFRPHAHGAGGKITFITKHICKLDPLDLQRELPGVAPFAPLYRKCIYSIRKWTIASRWNPVCRVYFRSNYALFKERRRQLRSKRYRMIIHPLSRFAMLREMIVCTLWVTVFIVDPLFGAFLSNYIKPNETAYQGVVLTILNCILLVDIILQFFIGFTIDRTKEIVLDHRRIIIQYVNTYFFYDFVPVAYSLFYQISDVPVIKDLFSISDNFHIWISIPQLYCLRFVRLYSMSMFFSNMLSFFRVRESIAKCTTIALVMLIIIHWWTCMLYLVPAISYYLGYPFSHSWVLRQGLGNNRRTLDNIYIECLLCTVCHFFGAGKGNIRTNNPIEQLILSLILMSGVTSHIYIIAIILQLFGTINVSETKYEELIYQLNEYMVTKKLPQVLRKRLLMYYEYRFQKQFFMENLILNSLSEHLRYEVLLYSCRNLINKVKLFQGAPKEVIGALVAMLKHEIFLPNDHIIKPDALNEHVYFISYGTVSVYLPNGKEAFHLEDGHHFGEVHVVLHGTFGDQFHASVMAVEITEVFYLDKRDFWYVVATHPEIADSLEKSALTKLVAYKDLMSESAENLEVDASDILTELRKGHILDRGRKRN
jgi:hyperpolarization activated cyclic nucleotide-gated potassium channel 2